MSGISHFIIGGAPRSGTTWLYALLKRHPEIYMACPVKPEPKFFLLDDLYNRGLDYYFKTWFFDCQGRNVAGEKSTNYLENAIVAERISHCLPEARLIFLLREPAERAYSNYRWSCQNKLETEDLEVALALEPEREKAVPPALKFARPHAYFSRGLYAQLLKPYFARFPAERILCLRFEDIRTNPNELAERVHHFLEVKPRPDDANELGVINCAEVKEPAMVPAIRAVLAERFAQPNRELAALLGSSFKIWPAS